MLVWSGAITAVIAGWYAQRRQAERAECLDRFQRVCETTPPAAWIVLGAGVLVLVVGLALLAGAPRPERQPASAASTD